MVHPVWVVGLVGILGLCGECACECFEPVTPYLCAPSGRQPTCPDGYVCCSTDPAAMGDGLPQYPHMEDGVGTTPLFSGVNNDRSAYGVCLDRGALAPDSVLADTPGCPVPCNPQWGADEVDAVCHGDSICCQVRELEPVDCVLDDGCWRPATGHDVFDESLQGPWGAGADPWQPDTHATHQDPGTSKCQALADGDPTALESCVRALSVADQRGYCLALSATVQSCPTDDPSYIDVCEQLNLDEGRTCG